MMKWANEMGGVSRMVNVTPKRTTDFNVKSVGPSDVINENSIYVIRFRVSDQRNKNQQNNILLMWI